MAQISDVRVLNQAVGPNYVLYNDDSVEVTRGMPSNSVHLSVFSPPFAELFVYSDSESDMGNSQDEEEFFEHFDYLIPELLRVTVPGRLCVVHCKQTQDLKWRDGQIGLRDFRG